MSDTIRLIARGFLEEAIVFQTNMEVQEANLDKLAFHLAMDHFTQIATGQIDEIEIEFPDDPPDSRFLRICVATFMPIRKGDL